MCLFLVLLIWLIFAAYVTFSFCEAARLGEDKTDSEREVKVEAKSEKV